MNRLDYLKSRQKPTRAQLDYLDALMVAAGISSEAWPELAPAYDFPAVPVNRLNRGGVSDLISRLKSDAATQPAPGITDRQICIIEALMRDVGISDTDVQWPTTVRLVLGPKASTSITDWSRSQAARMIDVLEEYFDEPAHDDECVYEPDHYDQRDLW